MQDSSDSEVEAAARGDPEPSQEVVSQSVRSPEADVFERYVEEEEIQRKRKSRNVLSVSFVVF